jgi:hypothetical protein
MFKEERDELLFQWGQLGDIAAGRPNLGDMTPVEVYRLMQYTLRDVLIRRFDAETAAEIFYQAGKNAGGHFMKNLLSLDLSVETFTARLQELLKDLKIGILRFESGNPGDDKLIITIDEDLDCSGLPMSEETVCDYDEGFLAGILNAYTGNRYRVTEIDCWANAGRTCRFEAIRLSGKGDPEKKD